MRIIPAFLHCYNVEVNKIFLKLAPLIEIIKMKILFLDESGDHNLTLLDPQCPLFVLTGCVIAEDYYSHTFNELFFNFKEEMFSRKSIVLRYADYTRNQNGFEQMKVKKFRDKFYVGLNTIIKNTEFILLSLIVNKLKYKAKYGASIVDPYRFSLEVIIEMFVKLLEESKEKGIIVAESRGQQLDNELNLTFMDFKIRGTKHLRPEEIANKIDAFNIRNKWENISGLQLVDSLATPIGRSYCLKENHYIDYSVIKNKFKRIGYNNKVSGLIIVPK